MPAFDVESLFAAQEFVAQGGAKELTIGLHEKPDQPVNAVAKTLGRAPQHLMKARREEGFSARDIPIEKPVIGAARRQRVAFFRQPDPLTRFFILDRAGDERRRSLEHMDFLRAPVALFFAVVEAEEAPPLPPD